MLGHGLRAGRQATELPTANQSDHVILTAGMAADAYAQVDMSELQAGMPSAQTSGTNPLCCCIATCIGHCHQIVADGFAGLFFDITSDELAGPDLMRHLACAQQQHSAAVMLQSPLTVTGGE